MHAYAYAGQHGMAQNSQSRDANTGSPPARSISNRDLALVASYLLTFLLRRWVSSVHVSIIQRLANCWATIQKQAHFSPILRMIRQSMSTLFLRHLA